MMTGRRLLLATCAALAFAPVSPLAAQAPRRWEVRGFDFAPRGVWRERARRVREAREAALARGDLGGLNAALAAWPSGDASLVVRGVLRVPVFLVRYRNTDTTLLRAPGQYAEVLLGSPPPAGRPHTVRTYYEEISNGLLSVQGVVAGWIALDSNDTWYEGTQNGLTASGHVANLMREAITRSDATLDFGQFDNDGPDGVPNSGDDDGLVDLVVLVHPELGGECGPTGNRNIWAHRYYYSAWTGVTLGTQDASALGGFVRADDYVIQSGLGGATACDALQIMPPGTISHEIGHGFGLVDLYDTDDGDGDDSEGIGHWGLMGSGNYRRPLSPAYMEGYSRLQLGWITLRDLTAAGTYALGPYAAGDTVFRIRPPAGVANPRGEYFLLENRQPVGSDTALIADKGPGLLIFQVDSARFAEASWSNTVNSGPIHGLALLQADGLNQLRSSVLGVRNRGDAGDPYPGSTGNTAIGPATNPALLLNAAGAYPGFALDSIRLNGTEAAFRLVVAGLTMVRASDTLAQVRVRGTPYRVFRGVFGGPDTVTVSVDSVQDGPDERTRYVFRSWSDGQERSHVAAVGPGGGTVLAQVGREYRLAYQADGAGTVQAAVASGAYVAEQDTVQLTAAPAAGAVFAGWSGDTTASASVLRVVMRRPFSVLARFLVPLVVQDTTLRPAVMGAAYADTLWVTGGSSPPVFTTLGVPPPGLQLSADGVLSGIPSRDSTFAFGVRVASGAQSLDLPLRLVVTAPSLTPAAVADQLLLGGTSLTADEIRYLDLLGNGNGTLDVGDVTAWWDRTGVRPDAATLARIMGRAR
jgi:M6 family metalloprotease-like protein